MLSILSLQVHIYLYHPLYYIKHIIPILITRLSSMQKMNLHSICISLSFLVAIFAVLSSTHIINSNPSFLKYLINFSLTFFSSSPITSTVITYNIGGHHKHHKKNKTVNPCEDFSPDFPPDTDTTSYICVDRNGCCNFTTVQAAVNAIPDFSQNRTIIWINTGIY